MISRLPRPVKWSGQVLLTFVVTYFILKSIRLSWDQLAGLDLQQWRPRIAPLVASFAVLLGALTYLAALWARMVRELGGPRLRLGVALRVFYLANLGRYVPGKLWQLAGLVILAGREGVSAPIASAAAVLGQIFALGAVAATAALGVLLGARTTFPGELIPWAVGLLAMVAAFTTVPPVTRGLLRLAFRLGRAGRESPQLSAWFGARWLLLYVPGWLGYGIAFGLLWSAFPLLSEVSWPAAISAFAGAYFLGYAAVFAPAGIGVREGAMAAILAPWLGAAPATVLAVIARLWMTAGELIALAGVGARGVTASPAGAETGGDSDG